LASKSSQTVVPTLDARGRLGLARAPPRWDRPVRRHSALAFRRADWPRDRNGRSSAESLEGSS
jgi:hypothetical protein